MNDINEHVRLQAIATIAKAATFRPPDEPGSVSISSECFYPIFDGLLHHVDVTGVLVSDPIFIRTSKIIDNLRKSICITWSLVLKYIVSQIYHQDHG